MGFITFYSVLHNLLDGKLDLQIFSLFGTSSHPTLHLKIKQFVTRTTRRLVWNAFKDDGRDNWNLILHRTSDSKRIKTTTRSWKWIGGWKWKWKDLSLLLARQTRPTEIFRSSNVSHLISLSSTRVYSQDRKEDEWMDAQKFRCQSIVVAALPSVLYSRSRSRSSSVPPPVSKVRRPDFTIVSHFPSVVVATHSYRRMLSRCIITYYFAQNWPPTLCIFRFLVSSTRLTSPRALFETFPLESAWN